MKIHENKTKEVAKKEDAQLPVMPAAWADFEDDDQIGTFTSYYSQYRYSVKMSGSDFQIIDNLEQDDSKKIVWTGKSLTCQIFHAHITYKLPRGAISMPGVKYDDYQDEDKLAAASSLASPFGPVIKSRGNFDLNGYGEYIDNKKMRELVRKRQVIIFRAFIKEYPINDLLMASLPATSIKAFDDYYKSLLTDQVPIAGIFTKLSTVPAKNDDGKDFNQVTFSAVDGKDSKYYMVVKSPDEFRAKVKPVKEQIVKTHKHFVSLIEGMVMSNDTVIHSTVDEDGPLPDFEPETGEIFVPADDVFPE